MRAGRNRLYPPSCAVDKRRRKNFRKQYGNFGHNFIPVASRRFSGYFRRFGFGKTNSALFGRKKERSRQFFQIYSRLAFAFSRFNIRHFGDFVKNVKTGFFFEFML